MNRTLTHILLQAMLTACLLASCSREDNRPDSRPVVITSIEPLADWITSIGGPGIRVLTLIPASADPHLFELSPAQLRQADRAAAAIFIGAGMEPWSGRLLDASQITTENVLHLYDALSLEYGEVHTHAHEDEGHVQHGAGNPHIWLDPMLARSSVTHIAAVLSSIQPDSASAIAERASAFRDSLLALHNDILRQTEQWTSKAFVADHNTWGLFAQRYNLRVAAVLERVPGRDASAGELREIIRLAEDGSIGAVFADERSARRSALQLSRELGLPLLTLQPVRTEGSYITMMRNNLSLMTQVMHK